MKNCILGVDPGFTGAVAALMVENETKGPYGITLHSVTAMPVKPESFSNPRNIIDTGKLAEFILSLEVKPRFAIIEKVTASPQMGVTSAFRFGEGFGAVCGTLDALKIKPIFVIPAIWKKHFQLTTVKAESIKRACEIFPNRKQWFSKKGDHGKAEAALLCIYGTQIGLNEKQSIESLL